MDRLHFMLSPGQKISQGAYLQIDIFKKYIDWDGEEAWARFR